MTIHQQRDNGPEQPSDPIEKLLPGNYLIKDLTPNLLVPVKSDAFQRTIVLEHVKNDVQNLEQYLADAVTRLKNFRLSAEIQNIKVDISEEFLIACSIFTDLYDEHFGWRLPSDYKEQSAKIFEAHNNHVPLSVLLEANCPHCMERTMLAKNVMQALGVDCYCCAGALLLSEIEVDRNDKAPETLEPHGFIIKKDTEHTYVYDAANPIITDNKALPAIFQMPGDFLHSIRTANDNWQSVGKSIIGDEERTFGVTHGKWFTLAREGFQKRKQ